MAFSLLQTLQVYFPALSEIRFVILKTFVASIFIFFLSACTMCDVLPNDRVALSDVLTEQFTNIHSPMRLTLGEFESRFSFHDISEHIYYVVLLFSP